MKNNAYKNYFLVFVAILIVSVLFSFGNFFFVVKSNPTSYDLSEVYYTVTNLDSELDVKVEDVRKEKGKEDVYIVLFKDLNRQGVGLRKRMTETEFETIVGIGNNTVSTRVYTLDYILKTREQPKSSVTTVYKLSYRRFMGFGQYEFSDAEIVRLAPELVAYANAELSGIKTTHNFEHVVTSSKSEEVTFQEVDWYNFNSSNLKPVPTIAVEDIDEDIPHIDIHDNKVDNALGTGIQLLLERLVRLSFL